MGLHLTLCSGSYKKRERIGSHRSPKRADYFANDTSWGDFPSRRWGNQIMLERATHTISKPPYTGSLYAVCILFMLTVTCYGKKPDSSRKKTDQNKTKDNKKEWKIKIHKVMLTFDVGIEKLIWICILFKSLSHFGILLHNSPASRNTIETNLNTCPLTCWYGTAYFHTISPQGLLFCRT